MPLSSPERVLIPGDALSKLELARYFEAVAPWMVRHVRGRPLTLLRCADGACTFMKHSKVWAPRTLRRVRIAERTKTGEYLVADDVAGLVGLAQMDVVEVHTWSSRVEDLERPDRLVLDLDPGPLVPWSDVVEAARVLRAVLEGLGLSPFVKTTGGVGLHVVVPLVPAAGWEACLTFARRLAVGFERERPARYSAAFARRGRERKILIDYLRNNRTNTSVAAFSPRARPGAPVSVPIAWEELSPRLRSDRWDLRSVLRRLARLRRDPWEGYEAAARPLP